MTQSRIIALLAGILLILSLLLAYRSCAPTAPNLDPNAASEIDKAKRR